jgi:hypothetical protein
VTVILKKSLLVVGHQLVELVGGRDALIEFTFHILKLLLETMHKVKHASGSLGECHDLAVLTLDLRVTDRAYEGVVGLNASELVFWGDFWQQR